MIDVFRIGISIGLTNNVSPAIKTIQRDLRGLEGTLDRTLARFEALRRASAASLRMPGTSRTPWAADIASSAQGHQRAPMTAAQWRRTRAPEDGFSHTAWASGAREVLPSMGGLPAVRAVRLPMVRRARRSTFDVSVVRYDLPPAAPIIRNASRSSERRTREQVASTITDLTSWGPRFGLRGEPSRFTERVTGYGSGRGGPGVASSAPHMVSEPWRTAGTRGRHAGHPKCLVMEGLAPRQRGGLVDTTITAPGAPATGLAVSGFKTGRDEPAMTFGPFSRRLRMASDADGPAGVPSGQPLGEAALATTTSSTPVTLQVHVVNAFEIGNAAAHGLTRGLRAPAAISASLPSPATMPWTPGLTPGLP